MLQVYKDKKAVIHPRGANVTKAILENIDIHAHHRFGIQTVSADGQMSELSEILYEGVEEVTSEENSDTESEMDMHAVIDENEYKHGAKRLVSYLTLSPVAIADPGVTSLIPARSHTLAEIDHEVISTAILFPSADSRRVVSYKQKYVHKVLVNCLVKLVQVK